MSVLYVHPPQSRIVEQPFRCILHANRRTVRIEVVGEYPVIPSQEVVHYLQDDRFILPEQIDLPLLAETALGDQPLLRDGEGILAFGYLTGQIRYPWSAPLAVDDPSEDLEISNGIVLDLLFPEKEVAPDGFVADVVENRHDIIRVQGSFSSTNEEDSVFETVRRFERRFEAVHRRNTRQEDRTGHDPAIRTAFSRDCASPHHGCFRTPLRTSP